MTKPLNLEMADSSHEVAYQDIVKLLNKHAPKLSAAEMLAIAANMVGKLVALQDQRTMTADRAMQVVIANVELGNQQAIQAMSQPAGNA